jgi:hypothetical protein
VLIEHIRAQQKLNEYLEKKPREDQKIKLEELDSTLEQRKSKLQSLMFNSTATIDVTKPGISSEKTDSYQNHISKNNINNFGGIKPETNFTTITIDNQPINSDSTITVSGVVLSSGGVPLGNILVYVKKNAETVRLFKTAINGVFQNNLPLPKGDYFIELEDPKKKYHFAKMKLNETTNNIRIFAE